MNLRKKSKFRFAFFFILSFFLSVHKTLVARNLPNFLILVASDAGPDFGCYGNSSVVSPNIDDLAGKGIIFQNAFLTSTESSAEMISLLCGQYAHTTRTEDEGTPLPDSIKIITSLLRQEDYISGYLGPEQPDSGIGRQFDWHSSNVQKLGFFLDSVRRKPFFAVVRLNEPHRKFSKGLPDKIHNPDNIIVQANLVDDEETRGDIALYYDALSQLDSLVGYCISTLRSNRKYDNTIIIFLSAGNAPFPREKGTLYDRGIKIPMIISGKRVKGAGMNYDGQISTIDIVPTVLKLADLPVDNNIPGIDFSLLLKGNIALGRDFIFAERNWHDCDEHMRCIRNTQYKLILNSYLARPFGSPADVLSSPSWKSLLRMNRQGKLSYDQKLIFNVSRPEIELYDIRNDPEEYINIAEEPAYRKTVNDMLSVLVQWMDDTRDFPSVNRTRADRVDRLTGEVLMNKRPPVKNDIQ